MTNKAFPRAKRIAQQIQETLSELIRRELRDPRLGMVTITEVRVASDLGSAKVYFSALGAPGSANPGSADQGQQAQEILQAAAPILRGPLGRALRIRHSPELRFVQDELIESGARLSALIQKAVKDDAARHVDDEGEGSG